MKKLLVIAFALALIAAPMSAFAAIPDQSGTVAVNVDVQEALVLTIDGAANGNALNYTLNPSAPATDHNSTLTTALNVLTNSADGYDVTMALTGGLATGGIPNQVWGGAVTKGFFVHSSATGTDLISGQKVMSSAGSYTAPNNTGDPATITNNIMIDWTVPNNATLSDTITYTASARL